MNKFIGTKIATGFDSYTGSIATTDLIVKVDGQGNIISKLSDVVDKSINLTYSELKELRDNSLLLPGLFYRITDYVTTVNGLTSSNARSVGHAFDIIVMATSADVLSEEAWAVPHDGDTYFKDSRLEAWQMKYRLDNVQWSQQAGTYVADESTGYTFLVLDNITLQGHTYKLLQGFGMYVEDWSDYALMDTVAIGESIYCYYGNPEEFDPNAPEEVGTASGVTLVSEEGKGTITWMKDEHGNECPYDFKNIQYKRYMTTDSVSGRAGLNGKYMAADTDSFAQNLSVDGPDDFIWAYTFSSDNSGGEQEDYSLTDEHQVHDNIMKPYSGGLPNNVMFGEGNYGNSFGVDCYNNSWGNNYQYNSWGNNCYNNSWGHNCWNNSWGNSCQHNSWGNNCQYNSWGNNCYNNSWDNDCYYNSYGNGCISNSWGNNCSSNSWDNDCSNNSWGNYCQHNSCGNDCRNNSWGNDCSNNSCGNGYYRNSLGNGCSSNSCGNNCSSNSWGNDCSNNSWGNSCSSNTFGNNCSYNTLGTDCTHIIFGNNNQANDYYLYIIIESRNRYINLDCSVSRSDGDYCQYIKILQGYNDSKTVKTITIDVINNSYLLVYPEHYIYIHNVSLYGDSTTYLYTTLTTSFDTPFDVSSFISYVNGLNSPGGFTCSGTVRTNSSGVAIGRTAARLVKGTADTSIGIMYHDTGDAGIAGPILYSAGTGANNISAVDDSVIPIQIN